MKKNLHKAFTGAFTLATIMAASVTRGQVSLPATSPYSQNFDTTPGASGTAYPTGWISYNGSTSDNSMTVGTSASTAGANYNYGSNIGLLGSGSAFLPSSIVLAVTNTTGKSSLKISYDVIKMREQGRSNSFNLEISTTSASSGFTAVIGGDYTSGTIAQGTVTSFSNIDISALDNFSGTVWIRWSYTELSGSGSRDGIALDNVSLSWGATPVISAPVATAASAVTYNSFNANWNAAPGASSYRLDVSTSSTFGAASPATDLFFSEYVEGSGSNKYLEIYNGTGATVNLSDYRVRLYANGTSTATSDVQLTGTLANGATIVLKNSAATAYAGTATAVAAVNFNGDDAIAIYKISTAANVDIFGRIGEDPGAAWTSASNTTVDKTLVRKPSVSAGVTVNPTTGFPTLESEWDIYNTDDVSNLGGHTYGGVITSFVPGYENLTVAGTTQAVTGLADNTMYYYRVRAVTGAGTSANSNVISVTTAVNTNPQLDITNIPAFGSLCIGDQSEPVVATVSGVFLTAANVTIGPLEGYLFSQDEEGPFTTSLTITQAGGTLVQDIYVVFAPTTELAYNGEIAVAGGGATEIVTEVSAIGVNTIATVTMTSAEATGVSTASIIAEVTDQGCSAVTENGVVFSFSPNPDYDSPTSFIETYGDGTGAITIDWAGLPAGTTYYVKAYAINNGGIAYSAEVSFTTDYVVAPVAIPATDIEATSFFAQWEASEGAESYRLDVSQSPTFGTLAPATDLFFSEYVEGSGVNKYVEIYNGTGAAVDLSDYRVRLYSNGSATPGSDVQLAGSLANGATIVLKNSAATAYSGTATSNAAVNFNGNDAVALFKISASANVDIIGRIGENPGTAWTSASNTTADKTLIRKSTVNTGVAINPTAGFPTLETEWNVLDQDDVTNLGAHTYAGQTPSFVTGYEDLEVIGTEQIVSGLATGTTYYYRVRAVAGNTSGNSNVIEVETAASSARKMAPNAVNTEGVVVYKKNNVLTIVSPESNITAVAIFDMTGKQLFAGENFAQKEVVVDNLAVASQILIVKAQTADNKVIVAKVAY